MIFGRQALESMKTVGISLVHFLSIVIVLPVLKDIRIVFLELRLLSMIFHTLLDTLSADCLFRSGSALISLLVFVIVGIVDYWQGLLRAGFGYFDGLGLRGRRNCHFSLLRWTVEDVQIRISHSSPLRVGNRNPVIRIHLMGRWIGLNIPNLLLR